MELPYDGNDGLFFAEEALETYGNEALIPLMILLASEVTRLSNELEILK